MYKRSVQIWNVYRSIFESFEYLIIQKLLSNLHPYWIFVYQTHVTLLIFLYYFFFLFRFICRPWQINEHFYTFVYLQCSVYRKSSKHNYTNSTKCFQRTDYRLRRNTNRETTQREKLLKCKRNTLVKTQSNCVQFPQILYFSCAVLFGMKWLCAVTISYWLYAIHHTYPLSAA